MAQKTETAEILEMLAPQLEGAAKNLLRQVYGENGMPWGTPFSELEDVSVELGQLLARSLMQQATQEQADQEAPEEYAACPGCKGVVEQTAPRNRTLTTRAGDVEWDEPKRYCRKCRRDFFPDGEVAEA